MNDSKIGAARPFNDAEWRQKNIGRLLLQSFRYFEQRLLVALQSAGYEDIKTVHLRVLRELDMGGTRISEIAERAGVTKQAMGQLVTECEKHQLLTIQVDPTDRRAKIVTFTGRGRSLIGAAQSVVESIEKDYIEAIGPRRYATTCAALETMASFPAPHADGSE